MSNADLLFSLGSPTAPSLNPLDDFSITHAGGDQLVELTTKLLEELQGSSNPRHLLERLAASLPGPLTPQMIDNTDSPLNTIDKFIEGCYQKLLSELLVQFKSDWLLKYDLSDCLKRLFVIESGTDVMLHDSLLALTDGLKSCEGPCTKLDFILLMIKSVLASDFVTSAVVFVCKRVSDNNLIYDSLMTQWDDCVKLLVSLPNQIANKLKGKIDKCFTPDLFTKWILIHIAKCIAYLSMIKKSVHITVKPLSVLLSRLVRNFKLSNSFSQFVQVLDSWSAERGSIFCEVASEALKLMETTSIETTGILIFKNCSERSVQRLITAECLEASSWKYLMCQKIPLLTFYTDTKIITNLIAFLGNVTKTMATKHSRAINSRDILPSLMLQLLSVWADKTAIFHTSQEQHLFISQIIVLGFNYLCNISEIQLQETLIFELQSKLFKGMPSHLENTTESIRVMGMITAECVVYHLNRLVNRKEKRVDLEFDFTKINMENQFIVEIMRKLSDFKFNSEKQVLSKGDDILDQMIDEVERNEPISTQSVIVANRQSSKEMKNSNDSHLTKVNENNESDLDSDDELMPYDLTNDVKTAVAKRPKYLRDLIDGFKEDNNVDIWVGSLEACEALVYKQLPEDDVTLGIEILDILVCLEKKMFCENFDHLRFSSAVAVVVVYPDAGAQHLCKEFHQDFGNYSIAQRMLMLDVLSAAARTLASPKMADEQASNESLCTKTPAKNPDWYGIVKARIESHTKMFHQPKKPPRLWVKNKFSTVAGSFLFPLLRGRGKATPGIVYRATYDKCSQEESCLLLVHLLKTCALIVACSVNTPLATRMGKELLEASWCFRFHEEARVREAVISCIAAVVIAVPPSRILSDLYDELMEARLWLDNAVNSLGIIRGQDCEVDNQCRGFAAQVILLINNALSK